ncbi:hypothetical protein SH449x_004952 [Pirellulaceae bacterium SH449]
MKQQEYVTEVGKPSQSVAMLGMAIATVISAALLFLVIGVAIVAPDRKLLGATIVCVVIFGLLMLASGWIFIRLARDAKSVNGQTTMPEWFIQVCGAVFFVGLCFTAFFGGNLWLLPEALGVALAMIGIRRLIHRVP